MYSNRFRGLSPYTPGEQPQDRTYIKLNTNECPFPPSPLVINALKTFDENRLRLYPDPNSQELRAAIARYHGVTADNVFVGNGSDEVLSLSYYAFFDSSFGPLQMPDLSFSFYPVFAQFHDVHIRTIPLEDDFSIALHRYVTEQDTCGTIFANPNAPTGLPVPFEDVADFLASYDRERIVISDEAYVEFGGESALPLLDKHPNLLVITTCSKSRSLAGARLGYAIGSSDVIRALFAVKNSFNSYTVNAVTQAMGIAAFSDNEYYREMNIRVAAIRDAAINELREIGWDVLPSKTNFIFARIPGSRGEDLYRHFRNSGILVRYFDIERIREFVRITIGAEDDMARVVELAASLIDGPKSHE